ncbi:BON domain-containing protein [Altererythrobacter sediminis]|uniref:BON domain-containing protein n=2 Tax=Allopontixanthobacter sediminis TaxID=1689985 RepID=A0A845ATL6_9SPHN|nr:BON domain-containing protein [Allopontixanthobacter sediminis]
MSGDWYGQSNRGRYGSQSYGQRSGYQGGNYGNDRGFFEKAGDEVKSWFGDDDAQRRRERDEHRGRGPKNYSRSDERIKEDVSDHLTDDGSLDASDIEVTVSSGEVTLDGNVSSRMDKRRAEDCAYRVSGINHVQNNLRVKDNDWSTTGTTQTSSTSPGMTGTGKTSNGA